MFYFALLLSLAVPNASLSKNVRVNTMVSDTYSFNEQTLAMGACPFPPWNPIWEQDGIVTFRGITPLGKYLLGNDFEIEDGEFFTWTIEEDRWYTDPGDDNAYMFDATFSFPPDHISPFLVPIEFTNTLSGINRTPAYRLPPSFNLQALKYFNTHATQHDLLNWDNRLGAMAFLPEAQVEFSNEFPEELIPAGRFLYTATRGGSIAVVDTKNEVYQKSAVVDLAVILEGEGTLDILTGLGESNFLNTDSELAESAPKGIASGDFDGDGDADLAVTLSGPDRVATYLGNGDGSFDSAIDRGLGSNDGPVSVAVGEFNADGCLDLSVANSESDNVSILLGNGDGTFQAAIYYEVTAGDGPLDVKVSEFNRDGILDLAVANSESDNVSILLGNGDGTFQANNNHAVGSQPCSIATGDFDEDRYFDLAVANQGSDSLSILWGDGNGGFPAITTIPLGPEGNGPRSVVAGPITDGDDYLDLAVANEDSNNVSFLIGTGTRFFSGPTLYSLNPGQRPRSIVIGSFNLLEDDLLDLATANWESGKISILNGNVQGGFDEAISFDVGDQPSALLAFEFKPQYTDLIHLSQGRNAGFGIEIVEWDDPQVGNYLYLFVTNHTLDCDPKELVTDCFNYDPDYACVVPGIGEVISGDIFNDGEDDLYVGNVVSVYRIDPNHFTPDDMTITNDELVATIEVGCGPQGIDAHPLFNDPQNPLPYIYVANAIGHHHPENPDPENGPFFGSITPINVEELIANLPPDPISALVPFTNDDNSNIVLDPILIGPVNAKSSYQYGLIAKSIALTEVEETVVAVATVSGDGEICSEPPCYPGSLAIIDVTSPAFGHPLLTRIEGVGEYTVGVAVNQHHMLVVANDNNPTSIEAGDDTIAVINGSLFDVTEKIEEIHLGAGRLSGSIAMNEDGSRAYVAREDDQSGGQSGLVVVDSRPGVPTEHRLYGTLGQEEGVFWAATLEEDWLVSPGQPVVNNPMNKIYQTNVNDATNQYGAFTVRGLWVMPEPLVIQPPPNGIYFAQSDGSELSRETWTHYELNHLHFSPVEFEVEEEIFRQVVAEIFTKDINKDGRISEPDDIESTEIAILTYDISNRSITPYTEIGPLGILTTNYPYVPFPGEVGDEFSGVHIDGAPVWSPDGTKVLFVSGSSAATNVNGADLFILDADRKEGVSGNDRINLTNAIKDYVELHPVGCSNVLDDWPDTDVDFPKNESDPHWSDAPNQGQDMSTIVFTRTTTVEGSQCGEPSNYYECEAQEIWMIKYDYAYGTVESCPVRITDANPDPLDPTQSPYYNKTCVPQDEVELGDLPCPLGDTDPKISSGNPWQTYYKVAFDRKTGDDLELEDGVNLGDYDLYTVSFAVTDQYVGPTEDEVDISNIFDFSPYCDSSGQNCVDMDLMPCWYPYLTTEESPLTFSVASQDLRQAMDIFVMEYDGTYRRDISDMAITEEAAETGMVIEVFIDGAPDWFSEADLTGTNLDLIWSREIYFPRPGSEDEGKYYPKK